MDNISCGTVYAFQGDEKDIVLFSTAITEQTQANSRALGVKPFSAFLKDSGKLAPQEVAYFDRVSEG